MLTTLKEIVLLDDDEPTNEFHRILMEKTELFDTIHMFQKPELLLDFVEDRLKQHKSIPGLFLIDILMPGLDGFEVIDELNDLFEGYPLSIHPKFVVLSGSNHFRTIEKFQRMEHTTDFVHKPLDWNSMKSIFTGLVA